MRNIFRDAVNGGGDSYWRRRAAQSKQIKEENIRIGKYGGLE